MASALHLFPLACGLARAPVSWIAGLFSKNARTSSLYSRFAHTFALVPIGVVLMSLKGLRVDTPADLLSSAGMFFLGRTVVGMLENHEDYEDLHSGKSLISGFFSLTFVLMATASDFCSTMVFATSLTYLPQLVAGSAV